MRPGASIVPAALVLAVACVTPQKVASNSGPAPRVVEGWVSYPQVEVAALKNIHAYRGKPVCQACHVPNSPVVLKGPGAACERCHQAEHTRGHEVGTVLQRKFPVKLPLVDGKVVCHTCHDPHDIKRERYGLRKKLQLLCLDCHPGY